MAAGNSGALNRPGKKAERNVAAMNLKYGRKRVKVSCPRPAVVESQNQALRTVGGKNGDNSGGNVNDDDSGDEVQILCHVVNSHQSKFVTLEENKAVEYTLEKYSDVLQFVNEKQKKARSSRESELEPDSSDTADSGFLRLHRSDDDLVSDAETNVGNEVLGATGDNERSEEGTEEMIGAKDQDDESRGEKMAGATEDKDEELAGATAADNDRVEEMVRTTAAEDNERVIGATAADNERVEELFGTQDNERGEEPPVSKKNKATYDLSRLRKRTRVNIMNHLTLVEAEELNFSFEEDDEDTSVVGNKCNNGGKSQKNTRTRARSSRESELELDSSDTADSGFLRLHLSDDYLVSDAETNVGNEVLGATGDNERSEEGTEEMVGAKDQDDESRGEKMAGATEDKGEELAGATAADNDRVEEMVRTTAAEDNERVIGATAADNVRVEELFGTQDNERGEEPPVSKKNKGKLSRLRKRTRANITLVKAEELNFSFEKDDDDTSVVGNKCNNGGESQKNTRTRARITDGESKKNARINARNTDGESQKNPMTGSSRNTAGESQKDPMTSSKKIDISAKLNAEDVGRILANSLLDTENGHIELLNLTKEVAPPIDKSKYKFRFPSDKPKPEKSEIEVEHDRLFALLNMYITSEQIGSTALEDKKGAQAGNNGAPFTTETDRDTLCSQGNHDLLYEDPVGLVCKYCSYVVQESRHMLPEFHKPRPRRPVKTASQQAERAEYPSYLLDETQGTGSKNHGTEDYKHIDTVWDLIPGTRRSLYDHQREGFEFIWKNLVGDTIIERLEKPLSSSGHGCIISHAPGTGKTRLTIVFLQSFMKMYPDSRPVIVAPKSLLLTWEEEFRKWKFDVPFHNMNKSELTGHEYTAAASLWKKGKGSSKNNETDIRVLKLFSWKMNSSILGITYQLFEHIVGAVIRDPDCNPSVQQMGQALLKLPTVLVLDEGHTPRNNDSNIYRFLHNVETKRRIILSGTPFQNNFVELHNTLCLVNPEFEKTAPKDSNVVKTKNKKTGRDLQSKWSSLTNLSGHDGEKLRELKALIGPFVHVHKGTILQENCPGLTDSMVLLRPTELQQELIALLKQKAGTNHFHYSRVMSIISVHPSLLPKEWLNHKDFSAYKDTIERLKTDPYGGTKTKFVIELCRMSQALNEKVVIFCQYLDPLDIIRDQLQSYFRWIHGKEVLYIKGSLDPKQRQSCINAVNDPKSNVRVLLASIKACSEGIHLVGVSRVVLLDVVWNPSVERQAISRAYRIGQQKMVYTYHLIDKITEMNKYTKQLEKDRLSELVFSSKDESHNSEKQMPDVVSEDSFLQQMFQRNDKLGNMIERICYNPKASNLADSFNAVAE